MAFEDMMNKPPKLPLAYVMLNPPLEVEMLRTKGDLKKGGHYYVSYITARGDMHLITGRGGNGIGNPIRMEDCTDDFVREVANENGETE